MVQTGQKRVLAAIEAGLDRVRVLVETQQLLGLGLTAGQIARRRHIPTKRVKTAAAVAHSRVAMDAVAESVLHLAQAAVVAEFADDQTAVARLTTAASTRPEQFDHIAQQLRDDREQARLQLLHVPVRQAVAQLPAPNHDRAPRAQEGEADVGRVLLMRVTVQEMEVGPPEPLCRGWLQTTCVTNAERSSVGRVP